MSDTAPRNPGSAPQRIADALLRSLAGSSALLRVTSANAETNQLELGVIATTFYEVMVSPAAMRKLKPSWQKDGEARWELLISASSVAEQVANLQLSSAQALFAMTLAVSVAEQEYWIESISSNEAFGQVYLYRLQLRQTLPLPL